MTTGIVIFENSKTRFDQNGLGTLVTDLTGSSTTDNILTLNPVTKWSSNDLPFNQGEYLKLTLPADTLLDTIVIRGHNFKDYSISYGLNNLLTGDYLDLTSPNYTTGGASVAVSSQDGLFFNQSMFEFIEDTSTGQHTLLLDDTFLLNVGGGEDYYFACEAKANGRTEFDVNLFSPGLVLNENFLVDLDAGTIVQTTANGVTLSLTIELVIDGIYRVIAGFKAPRNITQLDYTWRLVDGGATVYTGDGSSGIYLNNVQLTNYPTESFYSGRNFTNIKTINDGVRQTVRETDYSENTSYYKFNQVPVTDVHLVIYKGQVNSKAKENLINYTDFSTGWGDIRSTQVSNFAYDARGKKEAELLFEDASLDTHFIRFNELEDISVLPLTKYFFSVEVKSAGREYTNLNPRFVANDEQLGASFNLQTGIVEEVGTLLDGASITDLGGGWYRCSIEFTSLEEIAGTDHVRIYIVDSPDLTARSYQGDGESGILLSRPQLARSGSNVYIENDGEPTFSDRPLSLASFIGTEELGRFSHAGIALPAPIIRLNARVKTNVNNKKVVQKGLQSFSCNLSVNQSKIQSDHDLMSALKDFDEPVLLWLCGGFTGSTYYSMSIKPYRLEDIYRVVDIGSSAPRFYKNIRIVAAKNSVNLVEVEN
jgi:hypothetical protein